MRKRPYIAKITAPQFGDAVDRTRLYKIAEKAREKQILWVSAPAGSGKTTFVGSYLAQARVTTLWYSVDERDGEPAAFFYYFGLAIARSAPRFSKPMPPLVPEYLPVLASFGRDYFDEVFRRLKSRFAIVLDNYQEAPLSAPLHNIIATASEALPPWGLLIIVSRSAPPESYSRQRASDNIAFIGWNELRLTQKEAIRIARSRGKSGLGIAMIKTLHEKAEGWNAGFTLLLEEKQSAERLTDNPALNTPSAMFDYFAQEILRRMPEEDRSALLHAAFLPKASGKMLVKLTGNAYASLILENRFKAGHFITKDSCVADHYELHPLFREFLLATANHNFDADTLLSIKVRAAKVLEADGQFEDALKLLCEARAFPEMADILADQAPAMMTNGRSAEVIRWIRALPEPLIKRRPWLQVRLGIALIFVEPLVSRQLLTEAFYRFKTERETAGMITAWNGIIETTFAEFTTYLHLPPWIKEMEELLERASPLASKDLEALVAYGMFSACFRNGVPDKRFRAWSAQAQRVALSPQCDVALRIRIAWLLAVCRMYTGAFEKAGTSIHILKQCSAEPGASPLTRIIAFNTEAMYQWLCGDPEQCIDKARKGQALSKQSGAHVDAALKHRDLMLQSHIVCAAISRGDIKTAQRALAKIEGKLGHARPLDVGHYHLLSIWQALFSHDAGASALHCQALIRFRESNNFIWIEPVALSQLADAALEHGRLDEAEAWAKEMLTIADALASKLYRFMALLLMARARLARGEMDMTLKLLSQAFTIARVSSIYNFWGWRPDVMAQLCVIALEHEIETDFVRSLIRKRRIVPDMPSAPFERWPWAVKVYAMGQFTIVIDGQQTPFIANGKKTPLQLLRLLIALGGKEVSIEKLADRLWPDADGDMALKSFETTLHRLRKLLKHDMAIIRNANRLSIDERHVWIDARAVLSAQLQFDNPATPFEEKIRRADEILRLCRGQFLDGDQTPDAAIARKRFNAKTVRIIASICQRLEQTGDVEKAVEFYRRGLELDGLSEELCQRLMTLLKSLGRKGDAISVYEQYKAELMTHGATPSLTTAKLHKGLCAR